MRRSFCFFIAFCLALIGCASSRPMTLSSYALPPPADIPEGYVSLPTPEAPPVIEPASVLGKEPAIRVIIKSRRRHGIRKIPMETYLAGVIGSEMSRRWPREALKAQAVAARSYAYYRMEEARSKGRRFDVVSTQGDQVFRHRGTRDPYLKSIVAETRGEALKKNNRVVQAFYSSTCGGRRRSALLAGLATDSPIIRGGTDSYCRLSPFRNWVVVTTLVDMEERFRKKGVAISGLKAMRVGKRDAAGYVNQVSFADENGWHSLSGDAFRSLMGSLRVKSTYFNIVPSKSGKVTIRGKGFGHGVGMCQYGAKRMAERGSGYRSILAKYYPGIAVEKIY